jgi:hypothetical protein
MSDDRLRAVFEGPGSEADFPKPNAENTYDERIVSALERMVGRVLMEDGRQVWFPGATLIDSVIPDFKDSEKIIEYNEISRQISALNAISTAAGAFDTALHAVHDAERAKLNQFFRRRLPHVDGLHLSSVAILAGIVEMGAETASYILVASVIEMKRLERFRDANFTKGRGRRKNARAHHVADTLAQFYLKVLKERPTYGVSDGYPSTRFATALQEIFEILGINANIRGPAENAIKQITDADINRTSGGFNALAAYATYPEK